MMWNKWLIGIGIFFGSLQLPAQPVLRLEGKVAGVIRGDVSLETSDGQKVGSVAMERGKFVLEQPIEPGLYLVRIGLFQRELFLPADTVRLEGYVDPDRKEASQVRFRGIELNDRLVEIYEAVNRAIAVKREGPEDEWISLLTAEDERRAEEALKYIRREKLPELAAALAWLCRGTYYDTAARLYDALGEKGQQSACGKMLKRFMEQKKWLADGQPAPDFTVVDAEGQKMSPAALKGKIVVMDFWASWCGPCRAEMKYLRKLYEEFKEKNVVFVSISLDDTREKWQTAATEEQIPWFSWWDSDGFSHSTLREKYDFYGIPNLVVLDEQGRIAGKNLRRIRLRDRLLELVK